ncbi:hypothetical protein MNBD_GAMMA09-302 [hydrothermal vent metagenome]|uniref:Sll7028 protein n=1 Tax=hydrothermal vent metagenome TaxID=652676 RepID=A0A3B0X381_9ZZZZ
MSQVLDSISKASIQLILNEPFYGHVLSVLAKKINNDIPTLCITMADSSGRVELHINDSFWQKMSGRQAYHVSLLKHELLHFVFKHLLMMSNYQHAMIFNIAADIVVNQLIPRDHLPESALALDTFASLELEADQSVKYYYDKVLSLYHENISDASSEPDNPDWQTLKPLLDQHPQSAGTHELWPPLKSGSQEQIFKNAVDAVVSQVAHKLTTTQLSSLPCSLQQQISLSLNGTKAHVNWRRVLRLFTNNSSKTFMKNSIRRASRRYATVPGNKVTKRNRLLVVIDTSGSIGKIEYEVFFSELYHIYKTGAQIRVLECDTEITRNYDYRGAPPETVSGGGGTDFNAPLAYANTQWSADAIIYFTDGYAATPEVKPRSSMLWVISRDGITADTELWNSLPGKKVKINF